VTPPTTHLGILTANIGNPSPQRAERQLAWLAGRPEQILVLTETADSKGCAWLAERFTAAGYVVTFPTPVHRERGVMIVSRVGAAATTPLPDVGYLPHRAASVTVATSDGALDIIGLYVPSRDATPVKTERKQQFIQACRDRLPAAGDRMRLILGDFNILEPGHQPRYPIFKPFEYGFYDWFAANGYLDAWRAHHPDGFHYSWVGRTGDGYRYDHAFVSTVLRDRLVGCDYVDDPRTVNSLSDHSALSVRLAVQPADPLLVSDPTEPEQSVLF
jgi:exodeoxyribonuclease-3